MESKNAADGRYRTLLEVSGAIASQPTLKAVLQSLRRLLSSVVAFDSVSLSLLSDNGNSVRLIAFDRSSEALQVEIGTEISHVGSAVGRAIDEQKPIYIPDLQAELSKIPQLASQAKLGTPHSAYIFPISISGKKLGTLTFATAQRGEFGADDVELMTSVSSHVAVALESALATDAAGVYQRQLAQERDRLRLLLEINNQVVTQLDTNELFRSASASIRKYFGNDFTGFWLIDKKSNQLECAVLDFPGSQGFLAEIPARKVTDQEVEKMRTRTPEIWSQQDIDKLRPAVLERLKAESIAAMAVAPLGTSNGPLGVMSMGSKRPNNFGQEDLDILSQISAQISLALDNALAYGRLSASRNRLEDERLYLESEIQAEYNFEDLVGKSPALRRVLEQIEIVAPTGSTVLLRGETGTGKELIARAVHSLSPRRDRTFVRLNCAAIPSGLVESELFGHEKGAFTGALMQKRGRLELADHGTLFLDEIGDIGLELQPKLLRALQEQEFERLGSNKTIHVDVRLIAATHRDLSMMIRNNQFREDLFYRLNVFPIEIPPLRERREDIPLLVHYFVSRLSRRMQKRIKTIPKPAMDALSSAPWPGNVRELENFVERAVILTQGDELKVPLAELKKSSVRNTAPVSTFQEAERQAIVEALKAASGRISGAGAAAERLGLKRTTLQNKMRRLNVTKADY
ncbi:MAG TPA: sigma 54-interacting transcriptional regulator [Candidatus Polarisedimenticolia bacterium]|nr:sigma 54-interacting transcriptional regulator [Candidatus Polarisedimenticolia bacterium]